jgi:hypothetical protein
MALVNFDCYQVQASRKARSVPPAQTIETRDISLFQECIVGVADGTTTAMEKTYALPRLDDALRTVSPFVVRANPAS